MSSSRETDAARLVAIRVIRDWHTEMDQAAGDRMMTELLPGDRQQAPVGVDHTIVGAVTRTAPATGKVEAAKVTDPDRFLAWVEAMHPGQVVTTTSVDPTFLKSLLQRIDGDPDYETCDENGEVMAFPPGVEVVTTPGAVSTLQVRPSPVAADVIRTALSTGDLTMVDLLALPVGEAAS